MRGQIKDKNKPRRWRLRQARLDKGLTIAKVAELTHYGAMTISRAERGALYVGKKPDVRRKVFFDAMSRFYGVPADELERVSRYDEQ